MDQSWARDKIKVFGRWSSCCLWQLYCLGVCDVLWGTNKPWTHKVLYSWAATVFVNGPTCCIYSLPGFVAWGLFRLFVRNRWCLCHLCLGGTRKFLVFLAQSQIVYSKSLGFDKCFRKFFWSSLCSSNECSEKLSYFFQRTPACESGEPMNSMPCSSKIFFKVWNVDKWPFGTLSADSKRFNVVVPTPDWCESSSKDHFSMALADLSWALVNNLF